ncbi:hypothetical protein ACHAWF_014800 [Thalassiosira exigua]
MRNQQLIPFLMYMVVPFVPSVLLSTLNDQYQGMKTQFNAAAAAMPANLATDSPEYLTLTSMYNDTMKDLGGMRYIPDEVYFKLGFRCDVDAYGKEKVRTAGISQEHMQRAKCLTGPAEVAARAKRQEEIDINLERKAELAKAKADQKTSEDRARVDRLCSLAAVPSSDANLEQCKLEHFAVLLAPELQDFIIARHSTFTKKAQLKHLKKPRTALSDAKQGQENLVSVAFAVRGQQSKLITSEGENEELEEQGTAASNNARVSIRILLRPDLEHIQPSAILSDPAKLIVMCTLFDRDGKYLKADFLIRPNTETATESIAALFAKADLLFSALKRRFVAHIKRRVKYSQQSNPCLAWATKNLAVVAAWMLFVHHSKKNISCLDDSKCLLAKPDNQFLLVANSERNKLGAYLFFDDNDGEYIRSGSAMGESGMGGRIDQHLKRAKSHENSDNSSFYHRFPHSTSRRARHNAKDGLFDHLTAYVAVSFADDAATASAMAKDFDDGGLGYDVALSLKHNLSESPGFEGCGLIAHNKRKRDE